MTVSDNKIIIIVLLVVANLVFDPFEFAADKIYRGFGMLGTSLLILAYAVFGTVRGRFPWSGYHNAALDGRREMFWFYAIYYNAIGICCTLAALYQLGVFGS